MACDSPPRECLEWHIKPRLKGARPKEDKNGYRALCPAHDDHEPSLGISIGKNGLVIYGCFTKECDRLTVRRALIDVYGIGPEHLPIPRKEAREALDEVRDILIMPTKEDTYVRLKALARIDGYRKMPRGNLLIRLGALIGIARSTTLGYGKRDREGAGTSTPNTGHSHPENGVVNSRTSERRGGAHRRSRNLDSVQEPGPVKVQEPGPPQQVPSQREPLDDKNRRPAA